MVLRIDAMTKVLCLSEKDIKKEFKIMQSRKFNLRNSFFKNEKGNVNAPGFVMHELDVVLLADKRSLI